jgi:cytochrome b561
MSNPTAGTAAPAAVAAADHRLRHDPLTITLHWLTAILVIAQFALAELWGFPSRPMRGLMIGTHMSFGILLTLVLVLRIGWRITGGSRVSHASDATELLSRAVHYLLYALLAAEAVLGFTLRWSGGEDMRFFGLMIPPPFAPFSRPAHHLVGEAHNIIAWTIVVLAAGHAAAALFHHYVKRDDVLRRMLPKKVAQQA